MRYAPRFSKDEEGLKVVRADRVGIGQGSCLAATSTCRRPRRSWSHLRPCPPSLRPGRPAAAPAAPLPSPGACSLAPAPAPSAPAPAPEPPAAPAGRRSDHRRACFRRTAGPRGASRGLAGSGDLRRDPQGAARRRHRSTDRRRQGSPRGHDRRPQEGHRRSLSHRCRAPRDRRRPSTERRIPP